MTLSKTVILSKVLLRHVEKIKEKTGILTKIQDLARHLKTNIIEKLQPILKIDLADKAVLLDPRYKEQGFINDTKLYSETYEKVVLDVLGLQENNAEIDIENVETIEDESEERLWGDYEQETRKRQTNTTPRNLAVRETDSYLKEPCIERRRDPIMWWKEHKLHFPNLYKIMETVLNVPASSVPCERIFSKTGEICTEKRNRLLPKKIEELIFVGHNYKK